MKCIPMSAVKLPSMSDSGCLWSHQVSQERCTTKLQVLQKAAQARLAVKGKTVVHRNCPVWHRTQQHGRRARGLTKSRRFRWTSPHEWLPQWDGNTKVQGWWHQTAVSEIQHPGYPLGLCFDNILYLPKVLIYWPFSPENSEVCLDGLLPAANIFLSHSYLELEVRDKLFRLPSAKYFYCWRGVEMKKNLF